MLDGVSEMELFFNECSLHGQFEDIEQFTSAIEVLMKMRQTAQKYNRVLYCHRNCMQSSVTHKLNLVQAIQLIDKNKTRALMGWFGRTGPYWEEARHHPQEEYLACGEEVVTDTAIGECAFLKFSNMDAQIVSLTPSKWINPELSVTWYKNDEEYISNQLINHTFDTTLEIELEKAVPPIQSWEQLEQRCREGYKKINFSKDAFTYLKGVPFVSICAQSFLELIEVLSRFKENHLPSTGRTPEGHDLYQTYFTGDRAWFSDSSDGEKRDFKKQMTFSHPEKPNEEIFAPYHGKVQCRQMRMHFSWPISADTPLYIVYIGPKITKT